MTALSIQPPFPVFSDSDGQPLDNGYIWIGTVNLAPQTNPISIYWDAALTQTAAQPLRTSGGYIVNSGTPAVIYAASDYSILVQNAKGSAVYSAPAPTAAYGDVIINASEVVYDPAGSGAVATTVQAKLRESVSVADFGFLPSASAAANTTAFANAFAASTQLTIPAGTYSVSSLPNFAVRGTRIQGIGRVVLNITGAGPGLVIDAGATPLASGGVVVSDIVIENLTIDGVNSASGNVGVFIRGITHSEFNRLRPINWIGSAMYCSFMVSNSFYDFCYSGNEPGITILTTTGLSLNLRGAGEECADCTWINPVIEGASTYGIDAASMIANTFIGGTIEGCGYIATGSGGAVNLSSGAGENTFTGTFFEANGISGDATTFHIKDAGIRNAFYNINTDAFLSPWIILLSGSNSALFSGGQIDSLRIDAGASNTVTIAMAYTGTITDNGTASRNIQLFYVPAGSAGIVKDSLLSRESWTPVTANLTVTGSAPTITANYQYVGDAVFFTINIVSPGGSTTTATAGLTAFTIGTTLFSNGTCVATNNTTAVGLGTGGVGNGNIYPPAWSTLANVIITGMYFAT